MSEGLKSFKYELPSQEIRQGRKKVVVRLASTDITNVFVQVIPSDGGETNLHSHANTDGFWMVLSGRARWYGGDDEVFGEFGPNEGVMITCGTKYWFEAASDETLEILHIAVTHNGADVATDRTNYRPLAESYRASILIEANQA